MTAQWKTGDLVQVTMVGVHIGYAGLGVVTLRLPSGALVPLADDEPGVTITSAAADGAGPAVWDGPRGTVPARPAVTSPDGGPGTPKEVA